jgi:hypothetical protein
MSEPDMNPQTVVVAVDKFKRSAPRETSLQHLRVG